MKHLFTVILIILLCVSLSACGKSEEAQKADELILAIGEVTVDSEGAILNAQNYYDSLTDEQKLEVENYDVLVSAQKLLPQLIMEALYKDVCSLIDQGDFMQASNVLFEHPDIKDYAELVQRCGKGVLQQYIQENGTEKESGKYFLNLTNSDGVTISVWHFTENNSIQFLRYGNSYGITDGLYVNYVFDNPSMTFSRSTAQFGTATNYQEGTIDISKYTGTYDGDLSENSGNALIIHGLTTTKYQSLYGKLTRGYQWGTMSYINEAFDALFNAVIDAGYKGAVSDFGFIAYKTERKD